MTIVKDGLQCYVVQSFGNNPYYLSMEYPMIRHNAIPSLLPVQVMEQNGEKIARYDITGSCSLMEWGEKRKIGYQEIKLILQSLEHLFHDLEEYLLSMSQVCFGADQIFINSSDQIYWLYQPEECDDILNDVNRLFLWILSIADYQDKQAMDIIYRVYDGIKKKEFGREFIESCLKMEEKEESEEVVKAPAPDSPLFEVGLESDSSISGQSGQKQEEKQNPVAKRYKDVPTGKAVKGIVGSILMAFDLFLIIDAIKFVLEEGMSSRMALIFAVAFFLFLLAAYELLQLLPEKIDFTMTSEMPSKIRFNVKSNTMSESAKGQTINKNLPDREELQDKKEPYARYLSLESSDSRILISDTTRQVIPVLLDQNTGEEIEMEVFPFYIGTKEGLNHLNIDSQGLSRQHAVISRTEDGEQYRLEDLNSSGGTWVDGRQIDSACPVILQEGSHIEFGHSSWSFRLAQP